MYFLQALTRRDILSFRDLTQIQYGIPENAKFLDGIRDLTASRENFGTRCGFWKENGIRQAVFGIEMSEVRDAGLS